MSAEILTGMKAVIATRDSRSPLVKSPEWQEAVTALSSRRLEPGETLRIVLSSETRKAVPNAAISFRQSIFNLVWKEGLVPPYTVKQRGDCVIVENPKGSGTLDATTILSTIVRLTGSQPPRSVLLRAPEWNEILEAVLIRGINPGEVLRVPLCAETQALMRKRPGGLRRLLANSLRPLWNEGLIPEYKITQRNDSVILQQR